MIQIEALELGRDGEKSLWISGVKKNIFQRVKNRFLALH